MMQEITQLITTVGFPIAACVVMGFYVKKQTEDNRAEIKEMRDVYSKRIEDATKALNENTLALQKLAERLDK